jgi:hypothetical protein
LVRLPYQVLIIPRNRPDPGGAYPNFMMDDEGKPRLKASYGGNYGRLAAMKRIFARVLA